MEIGGPLFTTRMTQTIEESIVRKLGDGAYIRRYMGSVTAVDEATNDISVKLLGSGTASTGFKVRDSTFPVVNDTVVACVSGQERWIEGVMRGNGQGKFLTRSDGTLLWGPGDSAFDTNLYRAAANILRSDDAIRSRRASTADEAFGTHESASTTLRFSILADGKMQWQPTSGAADTNLYRLQANVLKTDDTLVVGTNLQVDGTTNGVFGLMAVPFIGDGTVPGSATEDLFPVDSTSGQSAFRVPFAGSVIAISLNASSNRTGGTLTAQVYNASTATLLNSPAPQLNGTTVNLAYATEIEDAVTFGAGEQIRVRVTTSGFTPTTNTITAILWLKLDI